MAETLPSSNSSSMGSPSLLGHSCQAFSARRAAFRLQAKAYDRLIIIIIIIITTTIIVIIIIIL